MTRLAAIAIVLALVTGVALAAPTVLYQEAFDEGGPGLPPGWLPFSGQWALGTDETGVLQQTQPMYRGLARIVLGETDYEVSATVRPTSYNGQWGVGVVGYWQAEGTCYRLSTYGNVLALWREDRGQALPLAAMRLDLKPQAYRFRLALRNESNGTTLRGKAWAIGEREPDWLLSTQDTRFPLRFGRAGFFTGRCAAAFSDFALTFPGAPPAPAQPAGKAATSNHWLFIGGEWQTQQGTVRQTNAGPTPAFRAAAYALAAGWTSYTVQVNAKTTSGSRNQGFGLSAYWQDDGNYYQFGQMNGNALVLARRAGGGDPLFLATLPFNIHKGSNYFLKLRLENTPRGTKLLGKAWPANAGEPNQWQITAEDGTQPRLIGGDVGLWALDDVCNFSALQVVSNE